MHLAYYRIVIPALLLVVATPALKARQTERHALQNRCILMLVCLLGLGMIVGKAVIFSGSRQWSRSGCR
ncbi:hypothetical protein [Caballeronia sp. AZ1_KS37]|uniref:hypothetical protein n=1 Tax=Caballeronia sp. AZ1_KS37 TaxID=2921756 RepID=UPI002028F7F5|nr:hypothetical protein [Caballeronia sp. AZ1_KS37]